MSEMAIWFRKPSEYNHAMERETSNGLEWASEDSRLSTRGDIIRWWEARRHTYNAAILAVGFVSFLLVMIAGSAAVKPGEDFEEPLAMLTGTVIYVVMANICYKLGWVVDTVWYNGNPRKRLYKSGLILAVVLSALPGVWGWSRGSSPYTPGENSIEMNCRNFPIGPHHAQKSEAKGQACAKGLIATATL